MRTPAASIQPAFLLAVVHGLLPLVLSAASLDAACEGCKVKALVRVHEPVRQGQAVTIDCVYDLAGGTLYSINWRFKGREFLRLLKQYNVPPQPSFASSSSAFYVSPTSSASSSPSSSKSSSGSRGDQRYSGRQRRPKTTTKAPAATRQQQSLPAMNMVFTPVQGIDIDEALSQNGSVVLRNVTISSLGEYSCEVTRDFPTFESVQGTQFLQFSSSTVPKPFQGWNSLPCLVALVHLVLKL